MKHHYLLVCCVFPFFLSGCQSLSRQPIDVENLQMKMPIPEEGWTKYVKKEGSISSVKWIKTNERFLLQIHHKKPNESVSKQRAQLDEYVKKNIAAQFTSALLVEDAVNNYPRLIWQTMMKDDNGKRKDTLSLLIHGKDASYLITKQWDDASEFNNEKNQWLEYMKTIEVADTRYPGHTSSKTITPQSEGWVPQSK